MPNDNMPNKRKFSVVKPVDLSSLVNEVCEHLQEKLPELVILRRSDDRTEALRAVRLIAEIIYTIKEMKSGNIVANIDSLKNRYKCCTSKDIAELIFQAYAQNAIDEGWSDEK